MKDGELLNLIKQRRSIRKYKSIPVDKKDILEIVEAGTYAPSGANTQCYRFKIIEDKKNIFEIANNRFLKEKKWRKKKTVIRSMSAEMFANCPVIILVFADWSVCWNNFPEKSKLFSNLPYWDCGAAMQNMLLLAESKGLSTCWISMDPKMPVMEYINKEFKLSKYLEIMGAIAIGYSDEVVDYENNTHQRTPIKRKPVEYYIK